MTENERRPVTSGAASKQTRTATTPMVTGPSDKSLAQRRRHGAYRLARLDQLEAMAAQMRTVAGQDFWSTAAVLDELDRDIAMHRMIATADARGVALPWELVA